MTAKTDVDILTRPGRTALADAEFTPLDDENGMQLANGCDTYYFQIRNTDETNSVTVTATRVACPLCAQTTEPSGKGAVTVLAGDIGFLGPLDYRLYGQGTGGKDVYLVVTGSGSGEILALPVR